jgi:hypothetical protein
MKMRLPIFILAIAVIAILAVLQSVSRVYADITWQTPIGTIGLPLQATEALIGYDGIVKQAIGGLSLPVWTDPKGLFAIQLGAVAPWQTHDATIEPYVAGGLDILRVIPTLSQYKSAHVNVFGRWVSAQGKAGAGISFSYSFAGGPVVAQQPVTP